MRTSEPSRTSTSTAYVERVNRAIDHILNHLGEPLSLREVSRAALLSPFHFHRVFQALMGETLAGFVKRVRLERALVLMSHHPRRTLTCIALECGFASSSDFSRCFRQRYGVAPSRFDIGAWRAARGRALDGVARDQFAAAGADPGPSGSHDQAFEVALRALPARTVAYIRVLDPYQGDGVVRAVERLQAWAERHGLSDSQWLGYQWDDPEIASLEDCQYHVAVEAETFCPEGEIGRFDFPAMTVAEVEIRGGIELELRALRWLYGTWLPRSGLVPDDHPGFEAWIGRPFAHGMEHFEIKIQLPVRGE